MVSYKVTRQYSLSLVFFVANFWFYHHLIEPCFHLYQKGPFAAFSCGRTFPILQLCDLRTTQK